METLLKNDVESGSGKFGDSKGATQQDVLQSIGKETPDSRALEIHVPHKGDIFENPENGKRITVEGTDQDDRGVVVLYTESDSGVMMHDRKILRKPLENFSVLVGAEEMQSVDRMKGEHPEFYAFYEGEMEKTDDAFIQRLRTTRNILDIFGAFIEKEYKAISQSNDGDKTKLEKRKKDEQMIAQHDQLHDKIENIAREWEQLDDRFVRNGRRRMKLFLELQALEKDMPEEMVRVWKEGMANLAPEAEETIPDVEAVEKKYFQIILEQRVKQLHEKCDLIRQGRKISAVDVPTLHAFLKEVEVLQKGFSAGASSEDMRKQLHALRMLEHKTFRDDRENEDRRRKRRRKKRHEDEEIVKIRGQRGALQGEEGGDGGSGNKKTGKRARKTRRPSGNTSLEELGQQVVAQTELVVPEAPPVGVPAEASAEGLKPETAAGESAGGNRPEKKPYQGKKKEPRERARDRKLFDEIVKQLKIDQIFKQTGKPMLIIREISPEGIKTEYRESLSETTWEQQMIKPKNIGGFLDYLKSQFDWIPGQEKVTSNERGHKKKGKDQGHTKDKEGHEKKKGTRGKDQEATPPSEQPTSKERAYEELIKNYPAYKRGQCASVVAEGLMPLAQHTEKHPETTLRSLVEHVGEDKLIQAMAPAIAKLLPRDWTDQEKNIFIQNFAKEKIRESLE